MDLCALTTQLIGWYASGEAEDLHRLLAVLDPRCTIFGPGGENQYTEVSRFAHELPDLRARNVSRGIGFRCSDIWCRETRFSDVSRITYGGLTVYCDDRQTGRTTVMDGRFSMGFHLAEGCWKVLHIHFSVANPELQTGEHFPEALRHRVQTTSREACQLQQLAEQDALTGILNLRALRDCFRSCRDQSLWLIELDLDDFKTINDTYGHVAGNRVLTLTARILTESVRREDAVGRTGGDEFVILLPTDRRSVVESVLERICRRVEETAGEEACWTHLSIGAVPVRPDESLSAALDRADRALYQVKAQGKSGYRILDDETDDKKS